MSKERPAKSDSLQGRRLGAYQVEALLGEGAMGAVYAAVDVHLGRPLALKVIHRKLLSDETYCERFLREARAAARLNHPSIVQIYGAGTHEGTPFLAFELVEGGSVARYLRRAGGRLPARRALEITADAARGLAAAHEQGIVHRDVKPDNMLLDAQGRVKLGDFGIARSGHLSDRLTQSGFFVGTPRYSAPEQCRSEEVDGRTDLYALGVCLYEMLTGDVPFTAKTPLALLQKICADAPRPVRDVVPEAPETAARIAARLLAKEPRDRYQTAPELLSDLEAAVQALDPVVVPLLEEAPAPSIPVGGGSPGSASPGLRSRVSTEEVRKDLFGEEDEPATELAPASGEYGERMTTAETAAQRLAAIERLAVGGKPVAALRAAAVLAQDLAKRPAVLRLLLSKERRDAHGRDPFYVALGRVVAVLRDRGTRFRPIPSLVEAVLGIAALDVSFAVLAGDLADLVEARSAERRGDAAGALHVEALVTLADLGVGLPLPWKWDELPGAYDEAVVPLDRDGRQQVQAAAAVVQGLVATADRDRLRAWNERRRIIPIVSLENVGAIAGTSAGLPTLLAIAGAWLSLDLAQGVAATGAIDAASVPSLPHADRSSEAARGRFLAVRIGRVEAVREKVLAALEQCPDVHLVLVPAANRADLEGDQGLAVDLASAGIRLAFVETVGDALRAGVFAGGVEALTDAPRVALAASGEGAVTGAGRASADPNGTPELSTAAQVAVPAAASPDMPVAWSGALGWARLAATAALALAALTAATALKGSV